MCSLLQLGPTPSEWRRLDFWVLFYYNLSYFPQLRLVDQEWLPSSRSYPAKKLPMLLLVCVPILELTRDGLRSSLGEWKLSSLAK